MLTRTARVSSLTAATALAVLLTGSAALAGKDCECIGNGKRVKEGTVMCLQVGSSSRYLARCERNLNNTSWKRMSDGCPTAERMTPPEPASHPVAAPAAG